VIRTDHGYRNQHGQQHHQAGGGERTHAHGQKMSRRSTETAKSNVIPLPNPPRQESSVEHHRHRREGNQIMTTEERARKAV